MKRYTLGNVLAHFPDGLAFLMGKENTGSGEVREEVGLRGQQEGMIDKPLSSGC